MDEDTVIDLGAPQGIRDRLTDLIRAGAQQLITQAVEAELAELMAEYSERRTADGHAGVVRNGYQPTRQIATGIGQVSVRVPKVRSRLDEPVVFQSSLVPPYVRRTATLDAAVPWLYLKGVSSGEMSEALAVLVGPDAQGLSANVVSRLKREWQAEYLAWCQRDLSRDTWVYLWVDGIYSGLRAEGQKLCTLVVVGVNDRGEKHFLALEDGVRESSQSWREVLLGMKHRGLQTAPKVAVGDGALGFWAALDEVYAATRGQRCWVHKTANVLNYLPKSVQPKAKQGLQAIWMAATKREAERAFKDFAEIYGPKYPKAVDCLDRDRAALLVFYDLPAEHWVHLRTTNPIESTFATIRHRTKRSKGCLARDGMLAMMFKLSQCAQKRWRRIRGFDHLAKVIQGVRFADGIEQATQADQRRDAA